LKSVRNEDNEGELNAILVEEPGGENDRKGGAKSPPVFPVVQNRTMRAERSEAMQREDRETRLKRISQVLAGSS
jgi:hypothetical protein